MAELSESCSGGIMRLTLDRPHVHNALSWALVRELRAALARARADPAVHVVVLAGAGERAFCTGADLGDMVGESGVVAAHEDRGELGLLFQDLWDLGKPTVARVQGYALAGGFGLAMACDLVVAGERAVFGAPEVDVGLWPFMITVPLLRSMAPKVALELMLTGRRVSALEASRLGFVSQVVAHERLDDALGALAASLAAKPPLAVRLGRSAFYRALDLASSDALAFLQAQLALVASTDDAAEGIAAFKARRSAQWVGH